MDTSRKVSIIIPVYKCERYLDDCLASVLSQTYTNLDIILVDDGSPDACPAMCDSYAEKDERVRVVHQENQGLSGARNSGLRVAAGEYVQFLDSDDTLVSTAVEQSVRALQKSDADVVAFQFAYMNERGSKLIPDPDNAFFPDAEVLPGKEALSLLVGGTLSNYAWKYMVRRDLLEKNRIFFPLGKHFEDVFTTSIVYLHAGKVALLPQELVHYRQRSGSILHSQNMAKSFADAEEAFLQRNHDVSARYPELRAQCETSLLAWFVHLAWEITYKFGRKGLPRDYQEFVLDALGRYATAEAVRSLSKKNRLQYALIRTGLVRLVRRLSILSGIRYKMDDPTAALEE